ncbi:hypothetical protein HDE_10063 [Halotydeus destructor]|nr:hypothetical protein HDE_10063 [Halotydeus destructor]
MTKADPYTDSEKLKDLECLEKYTKCSSNTTERYKKYSAEMLNQVVRSARRSMESLCQSDQLKTIFLQNMKCTNTEKLRPLDVCADKITEVVIKLKEHNAYPLRGLCCARGLFELCVKNVIENACGEIVAKDFYTYSMTMLRGMLSIVELECDGQNQCSEMEIVSQTFSAKSVAQYNRSVIVEAIELIAQHFLGDDEDR